MKLENCGLEIQVKSMSYDQALAHAEAEAGLSFVDMHKLRMSTLVKVYGKEVADKLAADNGELVAVYNATLRKTWGAEGEGKNS